jgi:dTDP-4-amino-4,6-dideoxygalactose transaminase
MRFSNLQAVIGLRQMDYLDSLISKRRKIAAELIERLDSTIDIPRAPRESEANYFMFPIQARQKSKVFKKLLKKGIDSNLSYCLDCSYLVKDSFNPVAQFLSQSILTLNLPFDLQEKDVVYLAKALNEIRGWLN